MELITDVIQEAPFEEGLISTCKPFIEANTLPTSLLEIKRKHIIPVFIKDNEPLISHADFIEATFDIIRSIYHSETILEPSVRVSHPIKGRTPEARNKPANELLELEKTIFYERLAFIVEIPTIQDTIEGNTLSLTVGGIKAYNEDNLYSKKGSDERFKIFIGFKNTVCCNMCVWSDGYIGDLKVKNLGQLKGAIRTLVENYNANFHLESLKQLSNYKVNENQLAHIIGKCKFYPFLPQDQKTEIIPMLFGDSQINNVCRDYFRNAHFGKNDRGDLSLWQLYNLFTGANKSSYIDNYLEKGINAFDFVESLKFALQTKVQNWYLI